MLCLSVLVRIWHDVHGISACGAQPLPEPLYGDQGQLCAGHRGEHLPRLVFGQELVVADEVCIEDGAPVAPQDGDALARDEDVGGGEGCLVTPKIQVTNLAD